MGALDFTLASMVYGLTLNKKLTVTFFHLTALSVPVLLVSRRGVDIDEGKHKCFIELNDIHEHWS